MLTAQGYTLSTATETFGVCVQEDFTSSSFVAIGNGSSRHESLSSASSIGSSFSILQYGHHYSRLP